MVLVLCGHLQNDTVFSFSPYIREFCKWIFSFHMPMFFIVSGILFAAKGEIPEMKTFFRKRFSTIMVPYIGFSIIYFAVIIYGVFVSHSMEIPDLFIQLWYAVSMYGINVLWFLPALFFAEMLFALIMKKFSGNKRWVVMLLLLAAAMGINEARHFLPEGVAWCERIGEVIVTLIRPVFACSFITIGYLSAVGLLRWETGGRSCCLLLFKRIKTNALTLQKGDNRTVPLSPLSLIILPILLAVNIVTVVFNAPEDLRSLVLNNYALYYIGAVAGSGFVILLCAALSSLSKSGKAFPILRFFGRNSLVFMAVHNNPAIWILSLNVAMFVNQFVTRARGYISYAVIVLCFLLYVSVMIILINRFAPILAGKRRSTT